MNLFCTRPSPVGSWHKQTIIIIYSKNFSTSDWLKSHTQFIITSYCRPNLEEFCNMWKMTSIVQQNCQIIEHLTEKTWGRGWVVWIVRTKWQNISLTFHEEEKGELLAKNIERTARRQLSGRNPLFGEYFQHWKTLNLRNLQMNSNWRWT